MDLHNVMDIQKLKWPLIIIIGLEVLFLILLTLYILDLIELKTLVTFVVVEIVAGVIGYFLSKKSEARRNEREEERIQKEKLEQERGKIREELKNFIHKHNQRLIDTVIKPWYEDKSVSNDNKSLGIEHLQTGYADIWNMWQEYETLKGDISSGENDIKRDITSKLNEGIQPNFEHDFSIVNPDVLIADFNLERVENLIYETVETFSKNDGIPDNYKLDPRYLGIFGINIVFDKNNADLMEKSAVFLKLVETIIKDSILYEKFETVNKIKEMSGKKLNEFYQGLKLVEHDFTERHIELNGTCKDCKDWHEELKSLKKSGCLNG